MSLKISATPILYGKEAERFQKQAEENENKYAPKEEVENVVRIFLSIIRRNKCMV